LGQPSIDQRQRAEADKIFLLHKAKFLLPNV
jgi:hypothetical protein